MTEIDIPSTYQTIKTKLESIVAKKHYTKTEINSQMANKANASHSHTKSNITDFSHSHNTGEVTDPNAHFYLDTPKNSTQTTINTAINTVIQSIQNGLSDRKVFYVDSSQLPSGGSDWGYEEIYIVNYTQTNSGPVYHDDWKIYYWEYIDSPSAHFELNYVTLLKSGDAITSIALVPKSTDANGKIIFYTGDEPSP